MQDRNLKIVKADVPLICSQIEYYLMPSKTRYLWTSRPHISRLELRDQDGTWTKVQMGPRDTPFTLGALPEGWTDRDFNMIWKFWAEGFERGEAKGRYEAFEEARRLKETP